MKFTKILSLMLAMIMCVCVFAACGKKDTEGNENDNGDKESSSFVSITIVDNEGKELYKNEKLDIDPSIDGTEDGKIFVTNVLDLCTYYDTTLSYDYDEAEELLTINDLAAITGTKKEQVLDEEAMAAAKAEAEKNRPEGDTTEIEIDPIYKEVEFCYFWTMTVNGNEVGIGDELKVGDKINLSFTKISADELLAE